MSGSYTQVWDAIHGGAVTIGSQFIPLLAAAVAMVLLPRLLPLGILVVKRAGSLFMGGYWEGREKGAPQMPLVRRSRAKGGDSDA